MNLNIPGIKNKTALVTGGSGRIGRAVLLALADAGAKVVIHYNSSEDDAIELAGIIEDRGCKASLIKADLADSVQSEQLIQKAAEKNGGPISFLINNASFYHKSSVKKMTAADFIQTMQVNALSPFLITRNFAGYKEAEAVVNLLDSRIGSYDKSYLAYHASKRMLSLFTRSMALEFAPQVRVNGVAPGLILPPAGEDESFLARHGLKNPLEKQGTCAHVAEAILFLLRSEFITGQVIFVDGGRNLENSI